MHYTSAVDPVDAVSPEVDFSALGQKQREYIRDQLQHNPQRLVRQVQYISERVNLRGARVLDVGCGGGAFMNGVRELGAVTIGCELDDARAAYARSVHRLTVKKYPVEHDYWHNRFNKYFDAVSFWDVIEHVNDPCFTLVAARQLLKPGGTVFLDTPCRNTFYHRIGSASYRLTRGRLPAFLNVMYSDHAYGHKQIFSVQDMIRLLRRAGFLDVRITLVHELSFPHDHYLKQFVASRWVRPAARLAAMFFRVAKIRNKMIVSARNPERSR